MPLFAAVEKIKRKKVFTYLVVMGFVLNILVPFLKKTFSLDMNMPYNIPVVSSILIWPLIGWLLHNCELKIKHKIIIYILSVVGLGLHIVGTYRLSMNAGEIVSTFKGYQNVPCVLYSVGVFVFLKDLGNHIMNYQYGKKVINWLSKYTFPVYLMQFMPLYIFSHISIIDTKSMVYRLGAPFIIIILIVIVTWCLRKIPVIKHIVP